MHWVSHDRKPAVFSPGITSEPAVVRTAPEGIVPRKEMSAPLVTVPWLPLPDFHSPMPIVLLVPSWMSRIPIAGPVTWKTPLGGPPARWGGATHSMLAPYEAK